MHCGRLKSVVPVTRSPPRSVWPTLSRRLFMERKTFRVVISSKPRPPPASAFGLPAPPGLPKEPHPPRRTSGSTSPASASAAKATATSNDAADHGDIVAICDVDDNTLDKRAQSRIHARPNGSTTSARCSTRWARASTPSPSARPTTTMPPPRLLYMRAGKHCFCQKPLTHTIYEARLHGRGGPRNESRPRRWATRARPTAACARRPRSFGPARSAR